MAKPYELTWKLTNDEDIIKSDDGGMSKDAGRRTGLNIDMEFTLDSSIYATSMLREVLESVD